MGSDQNLHAKCNHLTYIPGKDRALEETIDNILKFLKQFGIEIKEVLWKNPLPHVYSVMICEKDFSGIYCNGKGTTKKSALASALGEFVERLGTGYFFSGQKLDRGPYDFIYFPKEKWNLSDQGEFLTSSLKKLYNLWSDDNECLTDLNASFDTEKVCCIPFKEEESEKEVLFPISILNSLYVSNGMSSGNTEDETWVQALCEIIERRVKFKIIAEEICLPDIPVELIKEFKYCSYIIEEIKKRNIKLLIKDASLGGVFPVVNTTIIHPETGGVFSSFGSHPDMEIALERTLTELFQGRNIDDLSEFNKPVFDIDSLKDPHNLENHFINSDGVISYRFFEAEGDYSFSNWQFKGNRSEERQLLTRIISEQFNKKIYYCGTSLGTQYVLRLVIPGVSEIYPIEDLKWRNTFLPGYHFNQFFKQLANFEINEFKKNWSLFESFNLGDSENVAFIMGFHHFQDDPLWSNFVFGEFKLLLALAASLEQEEIIQMLEYYLSGVGYNSPRKHLYECLRDCLYTEMNLQELGGQYFSILKTIYGEKMVKDSRKIINGEIIFPNIIDRAKDLSWQKNPLFATYSKVQRLFASLP